MIPPQTLVQQFFATCSKYRTKTALQFKANDSWESISFEQYYQRVLTFSGFLKKLDVKVGDRIALLSENRPEWVISDLGILCGGAANVPLYPTLQAPQIQYILDKSGASVVVVENREQFAKIESISPELPDLKYIIIIDPMGVELSQSVFSFKEVIKQPGEFAELEREVRESALALTGDTIASIVFTSGTTGNPKGVMLTHKNFMANVTAIGKLIDLSPDDSLLSFLPLSHVLERTSGHFTANIGYGARYAFAENLDKVSENIQELSPTFLVCVPRMFEKVYSRIISTVHDKGKLNQNLFNWAVKVGRDHYRRTLKGSPGTLLSFQYKIADTLVFSKLRQRFGGRIRFMISGGAPLEPKIAEFFTAAGLVICEGYGLTETAPVTNVNVPGKVRLGSVGQALENVNIKIADDGEILVKGPNVMLGYYQNPVLSEEVIDPDGWFKTGDIGHVDDDGYLWVTDRKKEILVTSGGKNIAPQPIENLLKSSPLISQAILVGDNRNFVSALIVPNWEILLREIDDPALAEQPKTALVENPVIIARIGTAIEEKIQTLPRFEQVKKFRILPEEWTLESGELTPTMKLKRKTVIEKYKSVIDSIYRM